MDRPIETVMPSSENTLRQQLIEIQQGDQTAAARFVQQYETELRREVRFRLRDRRLRQILDSLDICQSVLGIFFSKLATGAFEFKGRDELVQLLIRMVQNKVVDQSRRHFATCRDRARTLSLETLTQQETPSDRQLTPAERVIVDDLYAHLRGHLAPQERRVAELRAAGQTWPEIAQQLHKPADTLRRSFDRALQRLSRQFTLQND